MQLFGKALQKRLLSVLLDRTTFLTFVALTFILIVSALSFGEAWLQWSADKYAAVFNSFSDNLRGRSMQTRLCQHVPIDVVYTWVNGSDPWFQDSLKHYREHAHSGEIETTKRRLTGCPYDDCVASHFLTTDSILDSNVVISDVKVQNEFLEGLISLQNFHLKCKEGSHMSDEIEKEENLLMPEVPDPHDHGRTNRTFFVMESSEAAAEVARANRSSVEIGLRSYPIKHAYWTTDPYAPSSYPMPDFVLIKKLPSSITEESLLLFLPSELAESVTGIWFHREEHMAVVQSSKAVQFVDRSFPIKDNQVLLSKTAYLVLSPPEYSEDDSHAFNRFVDREELRYSLRSIEKYAPWVRRIFLVTNGQIPYWLNLDHPRLTLVTHEEIFEDRSHLPTFSSPAIEANLYRIPGLSDKFLYMNDDVFLGKEVWPEDFYTEHSGQKIYFSWPLPDCAIGCPNSWVKDGYCDRVCNTTECMFDGGECLGEQPRMGYADSEDLRHHWTDPDESRPTCAPSCLDNWLADKFCDESCNTIACGYDAGDCGVTHYHRLHRVTFEYNASLTHFKVDIPKSVAVAYLNVSKLYEMFSEVGLVPVHHKALRFVGLSEKEHVVTIVLYPEESSISFNFTLQAKNSKLTVIHEMMVEADTTGYVEPPIDDEPNDLKPEQIPEIVEQAVVPSQSAPQIDMEDSLIVRYLNETDRMILDDLQRQLENEEITLKGFNIRKAAIFDRYRLTSGTKRQLLSLPDKRLTTPEQRSTSRRLLDVYGDSLLHVNRVYNHVYGHVSRMVISHMPHLVDKNIFGEMRATFFDEWMATSKHRLRRSDDMQFAFAYFHYLMSETRNFNVMDVFEEFDTDKSDTWSDREIRTLLTRIHDLPLTLEYIKSFEKLITECATNLTSYVIPAVPSFERYFDSDLPVVSSDLVSRCPPLVTFLNAHFRDRRRYKYEVVSSSSADVAFKRLTSNLSQVVHSLDDLRRNPKKFYCINDNTDTTRIDDNRLIHAVLIDFLESLLPVPSNFELPPDYRNKFTHTFQLDRWKFYRFALTTLAYICVILLFFLFVAGYMDLDLEVFLQNIFRKVFRHPASSNSHPKRYTV